MTRSDLVEYIRGIKYAVEASATADGSVQAAVIGIAVTDDLHVVFDTLSTTRKAQNLRRNPRVAFVAGGTAPGDESTVQYEGIVDEPSGEELEKLKEVYYRTFPDGPGRLSWPGLIYMRARPVWIRYTDFSTDPPFVLVLDSAAADNSTTSG